MNIWVSSAILVTTILLIAYIPLLFATSCPTNVYGSSNKTILKYFSSTFCVSCWQQKPVIEQLAREKGTSFSIVEYDADFCSDAAQPHALQGVPSFIANDTVIYGYQDKAALSKLVNV